MTKAFTQIQLAPPENPETISKWLSLDSKVTFFSWKMFKTQPSLDYNFDTNEANKFIARELKFLSLLKRNRINFRYLKIVPDELPIKFFNVFPSQAPDFATQVKVYFQQVYPQTEVVLMSQILTDKKLASIYEKVYTNVLSLPLSSINPQKLEKEIAARSSLNLALKAFALFAAETAVLFDWQEISKYKKLILIAGERSIDTYKYEFFKYPPNRPILPKLFVI